ncbi:MAG: 4a-hydroxytetrahydrobiopterin dehydratase [Hyphomicrobiales bacterium]|nr:4a-hydroxytetrahydrobiopterin dehydratase [Hyphomicrobiales bacterium]MCY4048720.1 4a-hydroxytetrahydrobiopterin dehydratase [Hyphomicrobiales bacterium]MCY4053363.1 4a-hydroxytetrahydrobiopterin dehydratase [Hyphomicrobiales bacterium]
MRRPTTLSQSERDDALKHLPGWRLNTQQNAITKTFQFKTFKTAFRWMSLCADIAEKHNHHPDWQNVYNRVNVTLTTHSTKSLTGLDIILATEMDKAQTEISHE